ncbi:MAG: hybrid sensor histidine kinase/response regulator [Chloroflexi bacterium]|nr:hybrid sensor histidine kinase/response regulator [Chloroflexota bacterium]
MTDQAPAPLRDIVVVDDTPENISLLVDVLSAKGYNIRPYQNGADAIEAINEHKPDIILLDIMMPGMDGYEVCERLKANEATQDIPVIFISALAQTAEKVKGFAVGGVDYITKPFQFREVLARVETHLALRDLKQQVEAANAQLAEKVDQLEARNAELDAYSYTVAHDLKTPLSVLTGYVELLRNEVEIGTELDGSHIGYLDFISRNTVKMTNIIDALLLLAGVRNKTVEPDLVDMKKVIDEVLMRINEIAQSANAEIIVADDWPHSLGYGPWIEEVWINYVTNALKYGGTPPVVELGWTEQTDGMFCFWVKDNGAGLTEKQQQQVFVDFQRLHKQRAEGHGLGLSIVRRIVEKLNGQVGIESAPGEGSRFTFTLPPYKRADA